MLKKIFVILPIISSLLGTTVFAITLKDAVTEVLNTNPTIQERLKNFRSIQQDLNIANSEYYPTLDFRATLGYSEAGNLKGNAGDDNNSGDAWNHKAKEDTYSNYEASLTLTQNLFDGFGTMHKVDYEKTRIAAAAYNYIEKANDIAFQMVGAYVAVLRSQSLIQTATQNIQINETIYKKVKDLFDSGLTTDSEVKKIQSALSLAKSNLTVQKNNARDAEATYRKVMGRVPQILEMQEPALDTKMPQSLEKAATYSVERNPSLLVSRYNIKGAEALYKQRKKDYYPRIDLEVSQFFNDNDDDGTQAGRNGHDGVDDRFRARLVLNYNIFRGGADRANIQKHISKINQEVEIKRELKRQVIEGLELSWNSYEMIGQQLVDLRDYSKYSEETLKLYEEEYDLGRRSLLDLLSSQNDVINSRSQIIIAEYDRLSAKYRILDAMGLLVTSIIGDTKEFTSKVNLYNDTNIEDILDSTEITSDVDDDNVSDSADLCDNSLNESNVLPYGCVEDQRDGDRDGVSDLKDSCPMTPLNIKVSEDGCALDEDKDGVLDYQDKCLDTPAGYDVDQEGCTSSVTMDLDYADNSIEVLASYDDEISAFALFLNKNIDYLAHIIGHTSRTNVSDDEYNMKLSKNRADGFKNVLVTYGIDASRLTTEGKGFWKPIADNSTEDGRAKNRRIEIELSKREEML